VIPVIGLQNHRYQYYLTYSLVPCAILTVLTTMKALAAMGATGQIVKVVIVVWVALHTYSGASFFAQKEREGLNAAIEGTNSLISKARTVVIVRRGLANFEHQISRGTALVFEGVDIWAFDEDAGPRVWFNNATITAVDAGHPHSCHDGSLILSSKPLSQREAFTGGTGTLRVNLDRVLWFRLSDGVLLRVPVCTAS